MKKLCSLAAVLTAAMVFTPLSATERSLELRPGDSSFFWVDAKVPPQSADMTLKVELPPGFSFDQSGFIGRRFLAGKACYTGKVSPGSAGHSGYTAVDINYSFQKTGLIKVKPNTDYQLKMHLRHNIKGGDVRILWRRGTQNGSGIGYAVLGTIEGNSDWKTITFNIRTGRMEETGMVWFQKMAGGEIAGTIDLKSMEILQNGKALELNNNDFANGTGGWEGGKYLRHVPEIQAVQFRFLGKGTQGFAYSEKSLIPAGTSFRTAPFFNVGKDVPAGDYPVYISGNGVNETVTVKVRNNEDVKLNKLETAFWLAESPYPGWPAAAKKALINTAKNAGINTMYIESISPATLSIGSDPAKLPLPLTEINKLSNMGFDVFIYLAFGGEPQHKLTETYLKKYPEAQAKDWQGRPQKRICPTYMRQNDQEYVRTLQNFLSIILQKSKLKGFFWDVEYLCPTPSLGKVNNPNSAVDRMSACFCERCLKEFRKTYNIPSLLSGKPYAYQLPCKMENLPPEIRTIVSCYPMQWTQFALERTNFLFEQFAKTVKSVRQDAEIRSYTGGYTRGYWAYKDGGLLRWSEWCGIDYNKVGKIVDAVMGLHDLGFYQETEAHALRAATGNKKMILDVSTQDYFGNDVKNLYARIINIFAFCDAQGMALWGHWQLDGCDYTEIRRALKDVARFEKFLTDGKRYDSLHALTAPAGVKAATWILGSKRIVFVLNEGRNNAEITLKNLGLGPAAKARWQASFADGKSIADPGKVDFTLPAGEITIITLEDISYRF